MVLPLGVNLLVRRSRSFKSRQCESTIVQRCRSEIIFRDCRNFQKKIVFRWRFEIRGEEGKIIFDPDFNCAVINRQRNSQRDEMKDYSCLPAGKFAFRRLLIFSLFFFFFSRNTLRADHYVRAHYRDVTLEYHAAATVHVRNRIARKKFRIMRIAICMRVIAAMHRRLLESFIPRRTL